MRRQWFLHYGKKCLNLFSSFRHGWLHYTTDDVPVNNKQNLALSGEEVVGHSDTPIKHHFNVDNVKPWTPNATLKRERGYKIGTVGYSEPGENGFYTQPGHPQNPEHKPQTADIEEWGGSPSTSVKDLIGLDKDKEKWQKFYRLREKMNKSSDPSKLSEPK